MDWGYKAMLTMVAVALVLLIAQAVGRRAAGILAGLPIITAPALLWVASEHGTVFAARTAVGSIAACGLMAVFALVYERASRRRGPIITLALSLCAAAAVAAPVAAWAESPLRAIVFAVVSCALVSMLLPAHRASVAPMGRQHGQIVRTAVAAGAVSVTAAVAAGALGPFWTGVLAALPIISGAALVHQHLTASHHDIQRFLRGYVAGLFGKALFAVTFALLIVQVGEIGAVALAIAAGLAASLGAVRGLGWIEQRPGIVRAEA